MAPAAGTSLEQLAPFFNRAVRSHHGGTIFIAAHDDFQEDSPLFFCGMTAGPIAEEAELLLFAAIFHLTPSTVDLVAERCCAGAKTGSQ
jgi:hypothetical protein